MAGGSRGERPGERQRSRDRAERIIAARRRLASPEHREIDGEGIQISVDLDVMLMDAGIRPEAADALSDDEIRILLVSRGGIPASPHLANPVTLKGTLKGTPKSTPGRSRRVAAA